MVSYYRLYRMISSREVSWIQRYRHKSKDLISLISLFDHDWLLQPYSEFTFLGDTQSRLRAYNQETIIVCCGRLHDKTRCGITLQKKIITNRLIRDGCEVGHRGHHGPLFPFFPSLSFSFCLYLSLSLSLSLANSFELGTVGYPLLN